MFGGLLSPTIYTTGDGISAVSAVIAIMGCIVGVLGIIFSILTFVRTGKKDSSLTEARLVSMEKDIQYIRISVDGINAQIGDHDERIRYLESKK